jgi:peptidoglycan/LPS O-acetylase OafA/YrhL
VSDTSRRPAAGYRPDIDGLRAIAVVSVVLFHAFPGNFAGGFVGVDIFFAISGYLISQHIIETLDGRHFSLVDFYARRIKRIYPALIVVLLASLTAGLLLMTSGELERLAHEALASVAFVANLYFSTTRDYFSQDASASVLLHLWSLGVEEQYYIIWPVALFLLWRVPGRRMATLAIVMAILLSLASSVYLSGAHAVAAFYLPLTRFWELLLGSLLAWAEFHAGQRGKVPERDGTPARRLLLRDFVSLGGLSLIVASLLLLNPHSVFPGWRAALPAGGATLVIAAGPHAWLNRRMLALKPFVLIGLVSYPLYLWHWPILAFVRLLSGGAPTVAVLLAALACALALSFATFRLVEAPARFSRPARRYPVRVAGALFAMMIGVGFSSYAISRDNGLPERFPDASFGSNPEHWVSTEACKKTFPGSEFCVMPASRGHPEVALLGDSHANHYYDGLAPGLAAGGAGLFAVGSGNCPPFYGVDVDLEGHVKRCSALFDRVLDYVVKTPDIHWVVLSSYAISTIAGNLDYGAGADVRLMAASAKGAESNLDIYLAGLEQTLSRLDAAGKQVVFVLDTPELDFDPANCVYRPVQFGTHPLCAVSRAKVDQRLASAQTRILAVLDTFPNVKVFNPVPLLCDAQHCYARRNGAFLYADRDHLSPDGSRYVGRSLLQEIGFGGGA